MSKAWSSKMHSSKTQPEASANPELIVWHEYRAHGALVAAASIDPEQMTQWWGPHGFCGVVSAHS
jgi:hypothetical protein